MKLLLTILLSGAIYMSYYMANMELGKDVSVTSNTFGFSESTQNVRELDRFEEYQVIAGKPLFDPDREPLKRVVEKKITQQKVVRKRLEVQALGIAIAGDNLLAVVKNMRNGKIIKLHVNEDVEGWTLTSVSADSFVFAQGEIETVVKFKQQDE
jgi:hypothetical protein